MNCLAALSKCSKLRHLDLSYVSQSLEAADLCRATSKLNHLETFHYPHSGLLPPSPGSPNAEFAICPNHVRELFISGGLKFHETAYSYIRWPSSLTHLSIEACPLVFKDNFRVILEGLGPQLRYLKVGKGMQGIRRGGLNDILHQLPQIYHLSISLDYIDHGWTRPVLDLSSSLVELDIDCEDSKFPQIYTWHHIYVAFLANVIPNLRRLLVNGSIRWDFEHHVEPSKALEEVLQAIAYEADGSRGLHEGQFGVFIGPYAMPGIYPELTIRQILPLIAYT